jgi:2-methylisocitrate lyase-like PEP mutase family enzyme
MHGQIRALSGKRSALLRSCHSLTRKLRANTERGLKVTSPVLTPGRQFRNLMATDVVVAGGVYDGITAVTTQAAGFKAAILSGGYSAMSLGLPNRGLITMTEMAGVIKGVTRNIEIPVIVDGDTGYGNVANVDRAVGEFETAGAAGVFFEDQDDDPKCGYARQSIGVVDAEVFAGKIRAACNARSDNDFVIIARSDALNVYGWEELRTRADIYLAAGADVFFADGVRAEDAERYGEYFASQGIPTVYNGIDLSLEQLRSYDFRIQFMMTGMMSVFPSLYRVLVQHVTDTDPLFKEAPDMYDLFRLSGDAKVDRILECFMVRESQ